MKYENLFMVFPGSFLFLELPSLGFSAGYFSGGMIRGLAGLVMPRYRGRMEVLIKTKPPSE